MMWWNDGVGWGGWIAMTLVMVTFWALVIYGIVIIFRTTDRGTADPRTPGRDPQEILNERFARGEIDADEYRARQETLHTRQ